jgi:DNA polymerase-3 subunit beta
MDMTLFRPATAVTNATPIDPAPADAHGPLDARDLLRALRLVSGVVPRRGSVLPILACVRLSGGGGALRLATTDMDMRMAAEIPYAGRDVSACVPAAALTAVARELGAGPVELADHAADADLDVSHAELSTTIKGLSVEDFPDEGATYDFGRAPTWSLGAGDLAALLQAVEHCISDEETRYYLNGVALRIAASAGVSELVAAATDGHRLAEARLRLPHVFHFGALATAVPLILPRGAVARLLRLLVLSDPAAPVTVACTERAMRFHGPGWALESKLIDGTFPDYERLMPSPVVRATVERAALRRKLRLVSAILAASGEPYDRRQQPVRLTFDGTRLTVEARSQTSGTAMAALPLAMRREAGAPDVGGVLRLGFSATYLLEALERAGGDAVEFGLVDPANPMLVTSAPSAEGGVALRQVVMPMRI